MKGGKTEGWGGGGRDNGVVGQVPQYGLSVHELNSFSVVL
jgi:hypothetical protein